MIGIIKRKLTSLDKEMFRNLYEALVGRHLEYGNITWSLYLKKKTKKQSQWKEHREEPQDW